MYLCHQEYKFINIVGFYIAITSKQLTYASTLLNQITLINKQQHGFKQIYYVYKYQTCNRKNSYLFPISTLRARGRRKELTDIGVHPEQGFVCHRNGILLNTQSSSLCLALGAIVELKDHPIARQESSLNYFNIPIKFSKLEIPLRSREGLPLPVIMLVFFVLFSGRMLLPLQSKLFVNMLVFLFCLPGRRSQHLQSSELPCLPIMVMDTQGLGIT